MIQFQYQDGFEFDYVLQRGVSTTDMAAALADCGRSHWTGSVVRYHCYPVPQVKETERGMYAAARQRQEAASVRERVGQGTLPGTHAHHPPDPSVQRHDARSNRFVTYRSTDTVCRDRRNGDGRLPGGMR